MGGGWGEEGSVGEMGRGTVWGGMGGGGECGEGGASTSGCGNLSHFLSSDSDFRVTF